jgi:tetratricopeptide (TPR) repeat protein
MGVPTRSADGRQQLGMKLLAGIVLATGVVGWASVLTGGPWEGNQAPFPYVWRDVAIVHLLSALPLAVMVAVFLERRAPAAGSVALAAFGFAVSVVPLLPAVRANLLSALLSHPLIGVVLRAAPALGLTSSAALLAVVLIGRRPANGAQQGRWFPVLVGGLGVTVLLLPPWTYVGARCRHDLSRLSDFLEQSRFGEARKLAQNLAALDADQKLKGRPLPQVTAEIERLVRELEARTAVTLPDRATLGDQLGRARQLAMLGRKDEALMVLQAARTSSPDPEVDDLAATICEDKEEWETGLGLYRSARATWEARPPSNERTAGLLRATTGIAYCQRKLGQYAEAEAAYLEVLALSPTAESHFLLAQFYEDTQQADKARAHAQRAMALAPRQYRQEGEKLIRKLSVYHFGCLSAYFAETDRTTGSAVPK